jgi:hypothetical protein
MIRIELPKPLDHMSPRENKKYAQAMNEIAAKIDDEMAILKLLRKYKLKLS